MSDCEWIWNLLDDEKIIESEKEQAMKRLILYNRRVNNIFKDDFNLYYDFITTEEKKYSIIDFFENKILRDKYHDFWNYFCEKYPGTDKKEFQEIFIQIGL